MLYPLSYEGRSVVLPGPEPSGLALVRRLAGPRAARLSPRAVSHGLDRPRGRP